MKRSFSILLMIISFGVAVTGEPVVTEKRLDDFAAVSDHLKDEKFSSAWSLYKQGRGLDAYEAFMRIFRERPGDTVVNFALGLSARLAGKFSQASMAFERILMKQPDNARVRLELALTYYRMNQADMARMHAEKVLESNPPQEVAGNVNDLISRIKVLQSEWRTVARVSASLFYDTNPNAGPDSRIISIAPVQLGALVLDTLNVSDDTLPQETLGSSIAASFLGIRDIGRRGSWTAFGSLNVSHSSLENAHDYDTTVLGAVAGFELADRRGNLQIPLKAESIMLAGDSFAMVLGTGANYSKALNSGSHWISGLSIDQQNYDSTSTRDSLRVSFSQGMRWRVAGSASLTAGVVVHSEKADDDIYSNTGFEPYVGGFYQLSRKWRIQGRLSYKSANYDERELLAPEEREDSRLSMSVEARWNWTQDLDVGVTCQLMDNNSTFDIYEYDRQLVGVNLNWRFL